jgi:hypothetical protein
MLRSALIGLWRAKRPESIDREAVLRGMILLHVGLDGDNHRGLVSKLKNARSTVADLIFPEVSENAEQSIMS